MYEAVIAPISAVEEIPNAISIKLANVAGFQVIVGKEIQVGDLGIMFEGGLQLSHEMARYNNLYRHADLNLNPAEAGYLEDNRRIQTKKFMKQQSEGLWLPVNRLAWAGDFSELKPGDLIKEFNGKPICDKYYTKATYEGKSNRAKTNRPKKHRFFPQHFETEQLRQHIGRIPEEAILTISGKVHGSSGRTGLIACSKYDPESSIQFNWFQKLWNKLGSIFTWLPIFNHIYYELISGTRRVEITTNQAEDNGWYSGKKFRAQIHNYFKTLSIEQGMIFYYEIVGFCEDSTPIMPPHSIKDKELSKIYGERMVYSYGCDPNSEVDMSIHNQFNNVIGKYRILVYRISRVLSDGTEYEYPWYEVERICNRLGLETVPVLETLVYDGNREVLVAKCKAWADKRDDLGPHIREGVCVRVESPKLINIFKFKSFYFRLLEGLSVENENFVDPEDVS